MGNKTYLGDEVHELSAELQAARGEIELLKMLSERKDAEIGLQKKQIGDLRLELANSRAAYEEKSADLVAVTTILQQTAAGIGSGIQRVQRHKETREQIANDRSDRLVAQERAAPREVPPAPPQIADQARVSEYAPQPRRPRPPVLEPVDNEPPPIFLHTGKVRSGIVDSRLPSPDLGGGPRSQDEILQDMNETIGYQERVS